jgi:hypothetical protein
MKKIILLMIFLVCISSVNAISLGINIVDLKDTVCGKNMKIVSNPGEGYPLHFKLRKISNNELVWEGDSTSDLDYDNGDVIMIDLPSVVQLINGEIYELEMDVDMVAIHRPTLNSYVYLRDSPTMASMPCGSTTVNNPCRQPYPLGDHGNSCMQAHCTGIQHYGATNGCSNYKSGFLINHNDRSGNQITLNLGTRYYNGCGYRCDVEDVYGGNFANFYQPNSGLFKMEFVYNT